MGDVGDDWRWYREAIVPEIRRTRKRRLDRFHESLDALRDLVECYGIEIRVPDAQQIQFRYDNFLGNYYPATRKFFLQKPTLLPTKVVPPEQALLEFLRHALAVESAPESLFSAPWIFSPDGRTPAEVIRVGRFLMPNVRAEILGIAARKPYLLDRVDPFEFEALVAELLKSEGFDVTVTRSRQDGGKDIIALKNREGRSFTVVVECKRWLTHNVGIDILQRVVGVRHIERADQAMIVTTARFTEPAKAEARRVVEEVELIDRSALAEWLRFYAEGRPRDATRNRRPNSR